LTRLSTPVPNWWDGHLLLVPASTVADRAGIAAWAQRGLDLGEKLIYVADAGSSSTDSLLSSLARQGVEAADAATTGQLVVVEPDHFYSVDAYDRLVTEAYAQGYPGVRTCGGPHAAGPILSEDQFVRFEHTLEQMWTTRQVSALCRYGAFKTMDHSLDSAAAQHSSGVGEQQFHARSPEPGRLCLNGEVDTANDTILAAVVTAASTRAGHTLLLDCQGLAFASVSAWRALVEATEAFRQAGGEVRLTGLSKLDERVLRITGFGSCFALESATAQGNAS
jgi:anti-anti-sigma factor